MSLLRLDSASLLKRFFHLEQAVATVCGAWVPLVGRLETKAALARASWESALTAGALRERVFELRYPERDLEAPDDAGLINLFRSMIDAPSPRAFLRALGDGAGSYLGAAYARYLEVSDDVSDGPTYRFLPQAIEDKRRWSSFIDLADAEPASDDDGAWRAALDDELARASADQLVGAPHLQAPDGRPYRAPEVAARDDRYFPCSFYWPDNFDPNYAYGEGLRLRVRSAVSHVNEVWATDTAGVILVSYADRLGWEWIKDAARWLYDESRHMTMGARRLRAWGVPEREIPLGSYIYEAGAGRGPLYRLGMLAYFETKNIGKKVQRAQAFGELGDTASRVDMEFDWADEAIHAGYGRTWLRRALEAEGRVPDEWPDVVNGCERLVVERVERATSDEQRAIYEQADRLVRLVEEAQT